MSRISTPHGALTSPEAALAHMLEGLAAVDPASVALATAQGLVAAEMPPLATPLPAQNRATLDGWALSSLDLAGASSYSPVPLGRAPQWVEAGAALPESCDCVLEPDLIEESGALVQALGEAIPGEGVRRAGEDIAAGRPMALAGRRLHAGDLLALRAMGSATVDVRAPTLGLINVAAADGSAVTASFIAEMAQAEGVVVAVRTVARSVEHIAAAIRDTEADLIVLVGGTGTGRTDCTAEALASVSTAITHGLALRPGETIALARRGTVPVMALPGLPGPALSGYLLLVRPLLDRLSARLLRQGMVLPLARKIASGIGVTEVALLRREAGAWQALAIGNLSLDHIRLADAWLAVPGDSEGHAAGTPVEAFPLHAS